MPAANGAPGTVSGARRLTAARFAPRAIALVPWLDALVLVVASLLFANATARVPGQVVDLPREPFADGRLRTSLAVAVTASRDARVEPSESVPTLAAAAFLGDERYDLSRAARAEAFRADLSRAAGDAAETRAVVYLDGEMKHRDAMRLARLLRGAGVGQVLFAVRPPRER